MEEKTFRGIEDDSEGEDPLKSVEGYIIIVTGIHEEAEEDLLLDTFSEFGKVKSLHLNLDRQTGYVKGYLLLEYGTLEEAKKAIDKMDNKELLGKKVRTDWAFKRPPIKSRRN